LTLNGPGFEGIHVLPKKAVEVGGDTVSGALNNAAGNNTWVQNVSLWSDTSTMAFDDTTWEWATVGIGAERNTQLMLTGKIVDTNLGGAGTLPPVDYSLIKVRPGRVVLAPQANGVGVANTYRGRTEILQGYLNIR